MKSTRWKSGVDLRWIRAWFDLAPAERKFVAGILLIALIGLVARYVHLKSQNSSPGLPESVKRLDVVGGL